MKFTYRSFTALLLCFVIVFTLSSCKSQKEDDAVQLNVVSSVPAPAEAEVSPTLASIALTFNQALRAPADAGKISLKEKDTERSVALGPVETVASGAFITLAEKLSPGTIYILRLEAGALTSLTGFAMEEYTLEFTTGSAQDSDTQPPVLLQTYPENNGKDFDPSGDMFLLFNEPVMQGANYEQISLIASDGNQVSFTKNIVGSQLTIHGEMKPDSVYTLIIPSGAIRDYAMNDFTESVYLEFTTVGQPVSDKPEQVKPLAVVTTIPQDGMANVSVSTIVSIVFNESIQKGSAADSITIIPSTGGNNCITGKEFTGNTLKLNAALTSGTTYKVTIPANAALSSAGTGNIQKVFQFTTARPQTPSKPDITPPVKDTQPPQVVLSVPTAKETNVPMNLAQIRVRFQENIVQGKAFFDCRLIDASGGKMAAVFGVSGSMLTVSLSEPLKAGTVYTLTLPAQAVADTAGNSLAEAWDLSFTTAKVEVTTQPPLTTTTASQTTTTPANTTTTTGVQEPVTINFAGQSYPSNTKEITVKDIPLTDLSALSGFKNLETLTLNNNGITDISVLASLINLKHLNLELNQISDLSPISSLTGLRTLSVRFNLIEDISALKGLTNLKELVLADNGITDISGLRSLTGLQNLSITNNMITSLEPLSGMKQLATLAAEFNQISNVMPLAGLNKLQTLYLSKNNLKNVSALASLQELRDLLLSSNQIADTKGLEELKKLNSLYLSDNPLTQSQISNLKLVLTGCNVVF